MKKVLIVFPTAWDRKQLTACRQAWQGSYEVLFTEPGDEECPWDFDVLGFIDRTVRDFRGRIDGVMSSSDYPGATVAAAIASQLGLPGPRPEAVLRASHKYYSRLEQRIAAPEATPGFVLVRAGRSGEKPQDLRFPCFIKPVKGAFSVLSRRIDDPAQLETFLTRPEVREFTENYMYIFNRLLGRYTDFPIDGRNFLAEELLHGRQVTVEGFSCNGRTDILGVVDSAMYPETSSFMRFDYPSALPGEIQYRMADIARRVVRGLGLSNAMFNIEMMYEPESGRVDIIEVNPRICGQFADLYRKVDGTGGYEVALALVTGGRPVLRRRAGNYRLAASFPLRMFAPVRVLQAPAAADILAAESMFPETLVWSECCPGQELSDFVALEDGESCRYGIINLGAPDSPTLLNRGEQVRKRLGFAFLSTNMGEDF